MSKPNQDTAIDNLVRDLTKVHPMPKSLVRSKIEALITQARLEGRKIQAEADLDKWNLYMEENIGTEFDTYLKGQIESHSFELKREQENG